MLDRPECLIAHRRERSESSSATRTLPLLAPTLIGWALPPSRRQSVNDALISSEDHTIKVDVQATNALYHTFVDGDCTCACSGCRNFVAQSESVVGLEVSALLRQLGADPNQPVEITLFGPNNRGGHIYQIDWPIVGVELPEANGSTQTRVIPKDLRLKPGGVPSRKFDATGHRWTMSILRENVPWLLDDPPGP